MKYKSKPKIVDAFQMTQEAAKNPDVWPEWLKDIYEPDFLKITNKNINHIQRDSPERFKYSVYSKGWRTMVRGDDYVVLSKNGDLDVYWPESFLEKFDIIEEQEKKE